MRLIRRVAPFCLLLAVSYFAWAWLLKPGFYDTHDGLIYLQRMWHFDQAIRQGQYYPRWLPDAMAGLGVPFFNFNWSLPYYAGFILHAFNLSYPQVFKLLMLVSVPISGWGFYIWLQGKIGRLPAFVAGVFYMYAPYRFLDIYVRGALGEAWAFIFFPLIFLSLDHYQKREFFIIGSLSWAGLILTHNGLALIMLPAFVSYVLLIPDQRLSLWQLLLKTRILLLGLGFTAFFWLPALLENQYEPVAYFPSGFGKLTP